jgi:hypothetical protein
LYSLPLGHAAGSSHTPKTQDPLVGKSFIFIRILAQPTGKPTHMHVVRHQVPLYDLAFFLLRQGMENRLELPANMPENGFPPPLGHEHNMVLAVPLGVGRL